MSNMFGAASAKRGVKSFVLGKGVSAFSTFLALSLLVKLVAPAEYGVYVAYFAIVEISYLLSGFGLSTFAQKYVTELAVAGQYRFLRKALIFSSALRIAVSVIYAAAVYIFFSWVAEYFGARDLQKYAGLLAVLLVFEIQMRYFVEVFPALMWQGASQIVFLIRSLTRMLAYLALVLLVDQASMALVFQVDLLATLISCCYGGIVLVRGVKQFPASKAEIRHGGLDIWRVFRVCLQFYFNQVLGQIYGNNILKLLVVKSLGVIQAAYFGFAQSIADMVKNYLPGFLLLGVVRPVFVARYEQRKDPKVLSEMFNFVLKMNYFTLFPVVAFVFYVGEPLLNLLSHGKFHGVGMLFLICLLTLSMQCVHQVLGLINLSMGSPKVSIASTASASVGLVIGLGLAAQWGVIGFAIGAVLSEFFWSLICILLLRRAGFHLHVDIKRLFLMVVGCVVGIGMAYPIALAIQSIFGLLLAGSIAAVACLAITSFFKPFSTQEREWIRSALPKKLSKFFIW